MKKIFIPITILVLVISNFHYYSKISLYDLYEKLDYSIVNNESYYQKENTKENYSSKIKYLDKDTVNNLDEIYSMFYTVLNNGYEIYSFKCTYNCIKDLEYIDKDKLSVINQLVSVKNSYKTIETSYDTDYKVTLKVINTYTNEEKEKINNEIDRLIIELKVNNYPSIEDKIKVFHDYVADHSIYDSVRAETGTSEYNSNKATGPLFEGMGICDGYTDALSFYLDKLGLENIKVTNNEHVWNAVKLNGIWYHIDLTWDDPIYTNGMQYTIHDYFMLTTNELINKNDDEHNFDESIYDFIK